MKPIQHCIHLLTNRNEIINTAMGFTLQAQINGNANICIKREGTELRTCNSDIRKLLIIADDETLVDLEMVYAAHLMGHPFEEVHYILASSKPRFEPKHVKIIKPEDLNDVFMAFHTS